MKSLPSLTVVATAALSTVLGAPNAHALFEVARGTLGVSAALSAEYDTNIFANATEQDDVSLVFTPGVNWSRNVGLVSTSAQAGMKTISFTDTSGQDSIDPFLNINLRVDRAEKGSASFGFSYARTTEANDVLLDRTESDQVNGNGRIDYLYSEKTGVRFNGTFRLSDFRTAGFNDVDSFALGGGLLYRYSPKLTSDLTYSFSPENATNLTGISDPSSDNHRLSVGFEGALFTKVSGLFSIGYAYRDFNAGGSDDTVLLASSLSWAASAKTNFTLGASNNFDTTAAGQSSRAFQVTVGVRQTLTEKISISGNIGHQRVKLDELGPLATSREDDAVILGLNLAYRINDRFSAQSGLTHRISDSTNALAKYDRSVVSLGLNAAF